MRIFTTFILLALSLIASATDYDQNKPFGFCTRLSRTDAASTFNVTGGRCYTYPIAESFTGKVTVLKSNGQDMKRTIEKAVKQNDVIIFDGAQGDFIVSSNVSISASNKTLLGINNARLCTQWSVTQEIIEALNKAGVPNMSTSSGTGGILSNGHRVGEEAEYQTRQIIINMTNDAEEKYRSAGVLTLFRCQNIIIRNLKFVGPGSIDVGGSDLLSCRASKNCWIDHCDFTDGMDGNFDITQSSDFNTVSWCTFSYTERSYMHQNTNLIGYSDREPTGFLNTTYAFNWWRPGCVQRMPMVRVGKIHMLNNYFSCTTASNCINPRKNSEVLIEGNYFEKGVRRYYSQKDAVAVTWTDTNFAEEKNKMGQPASIGEPVTVPYEYTIAPYADVPAAVKKHAGATLKK
jgi:pectate lyase